MGCFLEMDKKKDVGSTGVGSGGGGGARRLKLTQIFDWEVEPPSYF